MHSELTSLLRSALFGETPDATLFRDCDWQEIFALAAEQTVTAIALDGVERLPAEARPPRETVVRLFSMLLQTEALNRRLNRRVGEFCQEIESEGFHPIIIKGQAIATEYPQPLHRSPGDIDVLIADSEEAERAFAWAGQHFKCRWMPGEKETAFTWRGVVVELHRRLADMQDNAFQRRLQAIIRAALHTPENSADRQRTPQSRLIDIGGHPVPTLPVRLAALHLIVHIQYHVLNEGCGLRQFCDLAVFLHNHHEQLRGTGPDGQTLQEQLRDCGIERMAAAIGLVLHTELGLPEAEIPFHISPIGADKIMDDVWRGGNFGKKRYGDMAGASFMRRKIAMFPVHLRQYFRYRRLLPREARANFISKFFRAAKGIK